MARGRLAEQTPTIPVAVARVQRGVVEAYYAGSTNLNAAEEAMVVARTQVSSKRYSPKKATWSGRNSPWPNSTRNVCRWSLRVRKRSSRG